MYTGLYTNTHTHTHIHTKQTHIFTSKQLLYENRGQADTHTQADTVTHAGKTIIVCEDGTNAIIHSVIQCSPPQFCLLIS